MSDIIWTSGDKKKGITVTRLNYKRPLYRVRICVRGRGFDEIHDFPSRSEAIEYARDRKRMKWYG